jgi:GntR family transcriptional repressor for pyruvate dehydrogenase complex
MTIFYLTGYGVVWYNQGHTKKFPKISKMKVEKDPFSAPPRRRLFDKIIDYFKEALGEGRLKPGDGLPSERELAMRLGVSRASLREALRGLEMSGFISIIPGQGSFILAPNSRSLSSFFELMFSLKPPISENILELRMIIECEATRLATRRATPEELAHIKTFLNLMRNSMTGDNPGVQADFEFHNAIIRATHNDVLIFLYETVESLLKRSHYERRVAVFNIPGARDVLVAAHEDVYDAMLTGQQEAAAERMREHFRILNRLMEE